MLSNNRIVNDLSKIAGSLFQLGFGVVREIKTHIKRKTGHMAHDAGFATAEDVNVVKALALQTRIKQQALEEELALLKEKYENSVKDS